MHKTILKLFALYFVFSLLIGICSVYAEAEYSYNLWVGGRYSDFNDYAKKVREYNHIYSDAYPEGRFQLFGRGSDFLMNFDGYFYDNKNAGAMFDLQYQNRLSIKVDYKLFRRQLQTDLLDNINAREELADGSMGGKMMTHEDLNPGFDYNYDRHRVTTQVSALISEKNNVRINAGHRFWMDKGDEQKVSSTHCFSCHLTSKSVEVDRSVNQFNIGLSAEPGPVGLSYDFVFSQFSSNAESPSVFYDEAKHPVKGDKIDEFGSRVIFDSTQVDFSVYPDVQKIGNTLRFYTRSPKYRVSGSASYFQTKNSYENENSFIGPVDDRKATTLGGTLNFSMPLTPIWSVIVRTGLSNTDAEDFEIDLPLWRYNQETNQPRTGGGQDFDYIRYSSLDRMEGEASVEFIYRPMSRLKISALGGYDYTKRYDYPSKDNDAVTNKFYGQAKLRYRHGLDYSATIKYRLEAIKDPFTSYRGLFEAVGHDELLPLPNNGFVYYFQREELKYQDVTSLPTTKHVFDFKGDIRLQKGVNLHGGLKFTYDKNDDLDSLDVEHSSLQPNLSINIMPQNQWLVTMGYTYSMHKSRGPITVAMFDG